MKEAAKVNKPLLSMALALMDAQTYENARPHLITLLERMQENPEIVEALQGILDA